MTRRPAYTLVPETLKSFRVVGMPTPTTMRTKLEMLLTDTGGSTAIVIFDALRCSSTLLACFAAGISGAFVMEKGVVGNGTSIERANEFAHQKNLRLLCGGELAGKPIPGAIVGNSPIEAWYHRDALNGALLHFQSTNFAKVFVGSIAAARDRSIAADFYVISFSNVSATAEMVKACSYDRVFLLAAGFFECMALEDMMLGGAFAAQLDCAETEFDDDALAMLACHRALATGAIQHGWTARVLSRLSKLEDVSDVLGQGRFPPEFSTAMAKQVLKVEFEDALPLIRVCR